MLNLDVTCPETGRHERIGCIADRTGEILVVLRCSRFDPPEAIACGESCRELAGKASTCSCHPSPADLDHLPSPNG